MNYILISASQEDEVTKFSYYGYSNYEVSALHVRSRLKIILYEGYLKIK